jgi:DNA-binding transcriptional MerR regulator
MTDEADFGDRPGDTRRQVKSEAAFRTISEVADELNVPQHVLRFWETKFSQIRPLKRGGGRRYYRPEDVTLLKRIRTLLYTDGLTIKGVQKVLREGGGRTEADTPLAAMAAEGMSIGDIPMGLARDEAVRLLAELKSLRDDLSRALQSA